MAIMLKVNTDALTAKASEVSDSINQLKNELADIQDIVSRSSGYWVGLAGDKARKEFKELEDDAQTVIKRFSEHPADLLTMAGVYSEAERMIAEQNSALPTDIIV